MHLNPHLNPYNSINDMLDACVTSDLYIKSMALVSRSICFQGLPIFLRFATGEKYNLFRPSKDITALNIERRDLQSHYSFKNLEGQSIQQPCMFAYEDYSGVSFQIRKCGSTDNDLGRTEVRRRAFAGDILQYRHIVDNLCCSTAIEMSMMQQRLDGLFTSVMEALLKIFVDKIIYAMFDPVRENGEIVTFEDETTEIDLTGTVSIQGILTKLALISDVTSCMQHYFWFVPTEFYAILAGLASTTACCGYIRRAIIDGQEVDGFQLSHLPMITIFSLNKKYFPVDGSGNIITPLLPLGSVAVAMRKPVSYPMSGNGVGMIDVMSLSREKAVASELKAMNFGDNSILTYYSMPQPGLNYNGEFAFFTSMVAGRIPAKNMYRVKIDANPTTADEPQIINTSDSIIQADPASPFDQTTKKGGK